MSEHSLSPLRVGLKQCCPRCGKSKLFDGVLKVRASCPECSLLTGEHDVGDGSVYCAMSVLCFGVTLTAVYMEMAYSPAAWVHMVVTLTLTLLLTPLSLRFFTAYIIATQHRNGELGDKTDNTAC